MITYYLFRLEHLLAVAALELGGLVRPHVDLQRVLPPEVLATLLALERLGRMHLHLFREEMCVKLRLNDLNQ